MKDEKKIPNLHEIEDDANAAYNKLHDQFGFVLTVN